MWLLLHLQLYHMLSLLAIRPLAFQVLKQTLFLLLQSLSACYFPCLEHNASLPTLLILQSFTLILTIDSVSHLGIGKPFLIPWVTFPSCVLFYFSTLHVL